MKQFLMKKRLILMKKSGTYSRLRNKYRQCNKRPTNRDIHTVFENTEVVYPNSNYERTSIVAESDEIVNQNINPIGTLPDHAERKGNREMQISLPIYYLGYLILSLF